MKTSSLAQEQAFIEALTPAADAAGRVGRYITLKNCAKAYVAVHINQGFATPPLISVLQATSVAGAGSKPIANVLPVFSNLDTTASDAVLRRADAVNYTPDAALKGKIVIIEVNPALLDINNGFDCIAVSTGASNVANITAAQYILTGLRAEPAAYASSITD